MPVAEKGVRGKGRQPLSPPSAGETGARSAQNLSTMVKCEGNLNCELHKTWVTVEASIWRHAPKSRTPFWQTDFGILSLSAG